MKLIRTIRNTVDRHPLAGDTAIMLVVAALAFFNLRAFWALQPPTMDPALAMTLIFVSIIPLTWRRLFPIPVLLFVTAAVVVSLVLNIPELNFTGVVSIIAIFSAAAYGGPKRNLACIISIAAVMVSLTYSVLVVGASFASSNQALLTSWSLLWNLFVFLATWWFGNTLRKSREQTSQLKESTTQLMREREANAQRAVIDERVRIARELHDVLAHHVSVMGIQAGAARQVLKQHPEKALNSLSLIETSSRQAVAELYRLLGLLRDERQVETFTPQPGLAQLQKLVADMQSSGLQVRVSIEGERHDVPQAVDLSAYRIIEEALTNTLKHAGPAKATVTLGYRKDALTLEITDTGKGAVEPRQEQHPGGKGLIGMRERVRLLSGEFRAGNAPNGGFRVSVRLPLAE